MSRHHTPLWTVMGGAALLVFGAHRGASAQDPLENAAVAPESASKAETNNSGRRDSTSNPATQTNVKPEFIAKSPAEWRRLLTRMQFYVTREHGTEPAFGGRFASGHFRGTFVCVCCDAAQVQSELFSSRAKFDSGTGWPSFYQAYNGTAVQTAWDYSGFEPRVEVMCRRCGAHLGHVFDDGPLPTGLRFCINSAAIKLVSPEADASSKKAVSKTSSKSKAKAKTKTGANSASKRSRAKGATVPSDSASAAPATEKAQNDPPPPTSGP